MDAARLYDQYAQRATKNQEQSERSTDRQLQRVAMARGGVSCGSWSCTMIRYARCAACKHRQKWTTSHPKQAAEPTRSATYKGYARDVTARRQHRKTATGSGRPKGGAVKSLQPEKQGPTRGATFMRVQDTNQLSNKHYART